MQLTGAEIVWECLLREGVDVVFGYPGGAILPVYDALSKYEGKLHHVLVRHEQGATHMADGYARATGRVGVAMATSGPGATNMVTGITTAMMDSSPIVCITGQVGSKLLGSMFDSRAIDEVHEFIAPKFAGGEAAPSPVGGIGIERMASALKLADITIEELEGDVYVHGRIAK